MPRTDEPATTPTDLGKDRGRGNRTACNGGEGGVGPDGCHADPAFNAPEPRAHDAVNIGAQPRFRDHQPHEAEQRHGSKGVFHRAVGNGDLEQVHRQIEIVSHQPDRDKGHDAQRDGDIDPEIDHHDNRNDRCSADLDRTHDCSDVGVAGLRDGPTDLSRRIAAQSVVPNRTVSLIGHHGAVKTPGMP